MATGGVETTKRFGKSNCKQNLNTCVDWSWRVTVALLIRSDQSTFKSSMLTVITSENISGGANK